MKATLSKLFLSGILGSFLFPLLYLLFFLKHSNDYLTLFLCLSIVCFLLPIIISFLWIKKYQIKKNYIWIAIVLLFPTLGPLLFYALIINNKEINN